MDFLILLLPISFVGYVFFWIYRFIDKIRNPEKYKWGTDEEIAKQKALDKERRNSPNQTKGEFEEFVIQFLRHIKLFF